MGNSFVLFFKHKIIPWITIETTKRWGTSHTNHRHDATHRLHMRQTTKMIISKDVAASEPHLWKGELWLREKKWQTQWIKWSKPHRQAAETVPEAAGPPSTTPLRTTLITIPSGGRRGAALVRIYCVSASMHQSEWREQNIFWQTPVYANWSRNLIYAR